jgi:RNA polymerase sigma-B factor
MSAAAERWSDARVRAAFEEMATLKSRTDEASDAACTAIEHRLVEEFLPLVRYLAARFARDGESADDLIQVCSIGLIKAVAGYDVTRESAFKVYAAAFVVGEIKHHLRDRSAMIKAPRRLQERALAISRAVERLHARLGRSPSTGEIASEIGISREDVLEAGELGRRRDVYSLDAPQSLDDDSDAWQLSDVVAEQDRDLESILERRTLLEKLEVLPSSERSVLFLRFYRDLTQADVAKRLGISQMHVSRLQHRALERLRAELATAP